VTTGSTVLTLYKKNQIMCVKNVSNIQVKLVKCPLQIQESNWNNAATGWTPEDILFDSIQGYEIYQFSKEF